ncbi:MAG: class II aldolase/adducin family protein [Gammaproteobacteria bacterium]|nr:class II aldolase/adducin family protein [Gammaproteobacteria bacterium]
MDPIEQQQRAAIVSAVQEMGPLGISQGTSGNISVRFGEQLLITPSGVPYAEMNLDQILVMDFDGNWQGEGEPSSEWRFHRDIMRSRPDVNAVVHGHPLYATSLAICRREIPAVHYMIAAAGGATVRCAEYATFGSEALSRNALLALRERNCCLLANHGMIALGSDLKKAMWLAVELENLAHQYVTSLRIGSPHILSAAEIEKNIELFRNYGPKELK